MGGILPHPTFLAPQPPIRFTGADIGSVLTVVSATELEFQAGSGGGGGGLPGRYTVALAGATSEMAPAGFPGTDTGSRIIVTCSADSLVQTLTAGNDGQLVLLWNNTSAGDGFNLLLANGGTGAGAPFLLAGDQAGIPPQSGHMICYDETLGAWLLT